MSGHTVERQGQFVSGDNRDLGQPPGSVYLEAILREAPKVLGLMDREPFSPTLGCMDRTYWAWKFTDFSGARFQEGLCILSFLYATECQNNPYYRNGRLLQWIAGGFDYWAKIQRKAGDFDEAYPYEHSLAATAFTSFYLSEAFLFLDGQLPASSSDRFRAALEQAGNWLCVHDERHGFLSNHLAAAAGALAHAHRICGHSRFEDRGRHFLGKILDHQSDEGWFDEYGGADPGYQTHGSFYLARYLDLTDGAGELIDSLERSFAFLGHFVHPDGSLGGEYASRNTQTYYPAALEMMADRSKGAKWIAETMRPSVATLAAAGLGSVDAYNYFPLLNNTVFAYLACLTRADAHRESSAEVAAGRQPRHGSTELIHFPKAGLIKVRRPGYELYVGSTKGGVLKAFDLREKRILCDDCGYLGRTRKGGFLTSQWFDPDAWEVAVAADEIVIRGHFYAIGKPIMTPLRLLGFRMFSLTLGRLDTISYWLKKLLVKMLIYRKKSLSIDFERRILLRDDGFTVRDRIQGTPGHTVESLQWVDRFTTIHMGSSRYFVPNELGPCGREEAQSQVSVDVSRLADGVTLERVVSCQSTL